MVDNAACLVTTGGQLHPPYLQTYGVGRDVSKPITCTPWSGRRLTVKSPGKISDHMYRECNNGCVPSVSR